MNFKKVVSTSFFVMFLMVVDVTAQNADAKQLNAQGYSLYRQEKYEDALALFKKACEADSQFDLAFFNYACTLGVLMKKDYPEWYYYKPEALTYLKKAVEINRKNIEKIKTDPDLEILRKEYEYYRIIGLSVKKTKDVRSILTSLTWYIQGQGVLAVIGGLHFLPDGTFKLWYHDPEFLTNLETNDDFIYTGTFFVQGNSIKLQLSSPMLKKRTITDIYENIDKEETMRELRGTLHPDGTLEFEGFEYKFFSWYDEFSA